MAPIMKKNVAKKYEEHEGLMCSSSSGWFGINETKDSLEILGVDVSLFGNYTGNYKML